MKAHSPLIFDSLESLEPPMIIGLTGGMGSGKSTAARLFEIQGFQRIDCDEIGHDLLNKDEDVKRLIKEAFGSDAFDREGEVDRRALGGIVFESDDELSKLEAILHPGIRDAWLARVASDQDGRWVVEIPLLFEKNLQNRVDFTVCVFSDLMTQVKRLQLKGIDRDQALARIEKQMPVSEKANIADYVLLNEGSLEFLDEQIKTLLTGI